MRKFLPLLQNIPLFSGIEAENIPTVLSCLGAASRSYAREEAVFHAGGRAEALGVVLTGQVQVFREDSEGNRHILAEMGPGDVFAEAYACARTSRLPVSVWTIQESDLLLLNVSRVISLCPSACSFHTRLVGNLLSILAEKSIRLNEKIDHLSRRTIREKLLSYLETRADREGMRTFIIPFNRQELADYLCVDRSALSRELGILRREGVLDFQRQRFTLL